ncbi:hypothetical protein C8R44DRAFT_884948 [Mycena epipterygia]|nr:hypothetical protein C8R44DRAFT_884948 [Mycena epipterygia]
MAHTCRYLHTLAFDKSVWLVQVDKLKRRSILDANCTPDLSTDELICRVRRACSGPETWSAQDSDVAQDYCCTPEISKEIILPPNVTSSVGLLTSINKADLLPSGRHALFNNAGILECRDVAADKLVWTHTAAVEHARVNEFADDEVDGGDSLVIVIYHCLLKYPVVRGTLAAVDITLYLDKFLLVDWKAQSSCILDCGWNSMALITLISGHIEPLAKLDGSRDFTSVSLDKIPKRSTFSDPAAWHGVDKIAVYASPTRDDTYRVWIQWIPYDSSMRATSCYELAMAPGQQPSWRKRILCFEDPFPCAHIVYSGHIIVHAGEQHRIVRRSRRLRGTRADGL